MTSRWVSYLAQRLLAVKKGEAHEHQLMVNAALESMLIHARALADFLFEIRPRRPRSPRTGGEARRRKGTTASQSSSSMTQPNGAAPRAVADATNS
jgi:hypothetical protein